MTTTVDFALDPDPGAITGTVTDTQTGAPISGASVGIYDQFSLVATATTDPNGQYLVTGLAPDNYIVVASAPNYSTDFVGAKVTSNTTTTANLALNPLPGALMGKVTGADTTNPIPTARIEVRNGPILVATTFTDAQGNYQISGLEPGTYTVTASAAGYEQQSKNATINVNAITTLNFALNTQPGHSLAL